MAVNSRRPPKNIWDVIFMPLGIAIAWYAFSLPIFILRQIEMPADFFSIQRERVLASFIFSGCGICVDRSRAHAF
jgi:hypothetical protein